MAHHKNGLCNLMRCLNISVIVLILYLEGQLLLSFDDVSGIFFIFIDKMIYYGFHDSNKGSQHYGFFLCFFFIFSKYKETFAPHYYQNRT